ncbi:hypothetical protein ACLB2K_053379 [Fragaria x ananassa]
MTEMETMISIGDADPYFYMYGRLFKTKTERDWFAGGGPWSFNGSMLILAVYDRLSPVEDVSLYTLEVWISVVRLRCAMRNHQVRVVLDVRNRILADRIFDYSSEVSVRLNFMVEKAHGICKECGFFGYGEGLCDKGLICGLSLVDAVAADGVPEFAGGAGAAGGGSGAEVTGRGIAPTGLEGFGDQ